MFQNNEYNYNYNNRMPQHDYYNRPLDGRDRVPAPNPNNGGCYPPQPSAGHNGCMPPSPPPCPPPRPNPGALPSPAWAQMLAEHNNDKSSHPYLLSLFRSAVNTYICKDTVAAMHAIEDEKRVLGLMVFVSSTNEVYRLETGISNDDWKLLNINSENYIKLGRQNPPADPVNGMLYFNLREERFYVYLIDRWEELPTYKDIKQVVQEHDENPLAHQEKFATAENKWFTI